MAKKKKRSEDMTQLDYMRLVRKPATPRTKVIHPDNEYDRRDQSWKDFGDGVDGEDDSGDDYKSWTEQPYQ